MHNFNIITKTMELNGETLTIETGRMAKQANGAVLVTYGESKVLVTATMSKDVREGTNFFPLTVDYNEKMYASGKIPGGFFKREAKPSTYATLNARLIDRTLRPLFPDGFRNAIHIVVTPICFDGVNDPAVFGMIGASAALSISDIPFHGPIAGVLVGFVDGKPIVNPTEQQMEDSLLELSVAGTESSIVMIEAGANEINEEQFLEAVYLGHEEIKKVTKLQEEFVKEAGKEKIEVVLDLVPEDITKKVSTDYAKKVDEAATIAGKAERAEAFDTHKDEMLEKYEEELSEEEFATKVKYFKTAYQALIKNSVRSAILKGNRVDGRGLDDIRDITCEVDIATRLHGSALFTRGETQSLGVVTLGTERDEKIIDGLKEEYRKSFYLHYNFPPFSVGEAGFMRGPGRRELGHGSLAERALLPMIPSNSVFPYTIRIVSEILESNGSSSMASVCSGALAMMAAGVPLKKPVAGIANGLIMEGDEYVVLADIMGLEDHLGDMDFKVTGTKDGITAIQMDIKIEGITKKIMSEALAKAKVARSYILDKMEEVISEPRKELNKYAPRIENMKIPVSKISEVIGSGGKTIRMIIEKTKAELNIDDFGKITIASPDGGALVKAKDMIAQIVENPERNKVYEGTISRIENYGLFVKFMGGFKTGMVHISNVDKSRIKSLDKLFKLKEEIKVKMIKIERGKIELSMKGIPENVELLKEKLATLKK
ncbi:MAG: polyribonucleotide nucleotidyltransferase [Candidatus Cloacimonadota bacterium]|nr:polyribonucleotide nucleotidyltransferase [Candidatus Cloacimonadota bacterium]